MLLAALSFNPLFGQKKTIDQKVDSLLQKMTIEEKVGQLNQYSGRELTGPASDKKTDIASDIKNGWVGSMLNVKGVKDTREVQEMAMQSRLKIPLLFGLDVIHGYSTIFPIPLAEAASWDLEVIAQSAHVAATEAAAAGIHWTFAPMVDVARDARWGRVMEGAGEDPFLGSMIAKARVIGFQGKQLGGTDAIMACAKHFAAYGAAIAGRDYNAVDMSEVTLWQDYLPPFKAAADAGVATFMNSFNTLNGVPATGNSYLQRTILKGKWNYTGFVVSDWNSIGEMTRWGYAENAADAASKAINAGSDMDMEARVYRRNLVELVKQGKVKQNIVDDAVRRVLRKKFELGLFDDPYKFSDAAREQKVFGTDFNPVARDVAKKSIVLLKNERNTLPLQNSYNKIALIGPLVKAKRDLAGSWSLTPDSAKMISLYQGFENVYKATQLSYTKGGEILSATDEDIQQAVELAKQSDIVIMALGETWDMTGESKSRADIHVPGKQEALFNAVKATGKPVVVVLMAGRPMIFNDIADKADAIVYAWWLGTEAGNAIVDVLTGKYNPAGKLPVTFPHDNGQMPLYYAYLNTGRPYVGQKSKQYLSAYIDAPNTPRYAFGYGLSYTTFKYSDMKLDRTEMTAKDSIVVTCTVANTGKYTGEEVVQLYLRDEFASVVRPVKELKGFSKIKLEPGQQTTVRFVISNELLKFYNSQLQYISEPGSFKLMIGSASDDIRLDGTFKLK